ncbi:MAG: pentapeptide repeat-containing protein [Enterobacteriaceae bacterium]
MLPVSRGCPLQHAPSVDGAQELPQTAFKSTDPNIAQLRDLLRKDAQWYREHHSDEISVFAQFTRDILAQGRMWDIDLRIGADGEVVTFHKEDTEWEPHLRVFCGNNSCLLPLSFHQLSASLHLDRVFNPEDYALTLAETRDMLVNCDLSGMNLTECDLSGLNLTGVKLSEAE